MSTALALGAVAQSVPAIPRVINIQTLYSAMPADASIYHHADSWVRAAARAGFAVRLTGFCSTARLGLDSRYAYAEVTAADTRFVLTLPALKPGGALVETAVRSFSEYDTELLWSWHPLATSTTQPVGTRPSDIVGAYLCAAQWDGSPSLDLYRLTGTPSDELEPPTALAIVYHGPLPLVIEAQVNPADRTEYLVTSHLATTEDMAEFGIPI